jgi:SAM-dependent methyltransferase
LRGARRPAILNAAVAVPPTTGFSMLNRLLRRTRLWLTPDHTVREGAVLPAPHLRFCGPEFKNDGYFLASARAEAERLASRCRLRPGGRVLDVGCGPGRLAIGLIDRGMEVAEFRGIDAHRPSIRWCARHLARRHPAYRFEHVDVRNPRYNPGGSASDGAVRLPLPDARFDVVYLYSVFSHMLPDGVRGYLAEIRRVLAPGGVLFFTGFVEDGVPEVSENPRDYRQNWAGPLHCVRYERGFLTRMLEDSGFRLERFDYGGETDGQSALYARPA